MFLNSTCTENVPKELENFYRYLRTGEVAAGDAWLQRMDEAVEAASQRKEVRRKVTLYDELQMLETLVKEAEERLGRKTAELEASQAELEASQAELEASQTALEASQTALEASQTALDRLKLLHVRLAELGRTDDIIKAAADEAYCAALMDELGIQ